MGSFPGHVLPGTLFLVIGVWHVWRSLVRYVSNPKSFRVHVWNPVPGVDGRLKYFELYLIAVGAFIDMCIELLYSTHLKFFVNGVLNPHHMNDFEHSGMLLMFFIFGVITLISQETRYDHSHLIFLIASFFVFMSSCLTILFELYLIAVGAFIDMCIELLYSTHLKFFVNGVLNPHHMNDFEHSGMLLMFFIFGVITLISQETRFLPMPEGALCLIAATAFCAEYLLFYFHSTTHKGLEGYYHILLVLLIGLCIVSSVAGALLPTSFPIDLCSGIGITLQGLWFYQTAFTLYGPMMPDGCGLKDDMVSCHSVDSEVRGELLANFQFFIMVLCVLVAVVGGYGFVASRFGHSDERSLRV